MTLSNLPLFLPQKVLRDQWSMIPDSPTRRTEMDDGAVAVERRFARVRTTITVGWDLDATQFELFRHWWLSDLDAGARWFLSPVFEGLGYSERAARFASNPPWQVSSFAPGVMTVNFSLELLDLPVISNADRIVLELWRTDPAEVGSIEAQLVAINAGLAGIATWR